MRKKSLSKIYLMPDENNVWHKVEPIEIIPGREAEALTKAYRMGKRDGVKELAEKTKEELKSLKFSTGRAWFDFDAALDRAIEKLDRVEKQLKEQNNAT